MDHMTVGEMSRQLSDRLGAAIRPKDISDLLYKRLLPHEQCPIVGGRRMIPQSLLPLVASVLRERGLIAESNDDSRSS